MATETELLDGMIAAARQGGRIAMEYYGRSGFREKADSSITTEADSAVERYLKATLAELLPEAVFLGEEEAEQEGAERDLAAVRAAEWLWVIDPIDGTAIFYDQLDAFCVCVGLLRNGEPYAGAIDMPALGQTYWAWKGQGAFWNGQPMEVRRTAPHPDHTSICVSRNAHHYMENRYPGKVHCFGATAYHALLVARGTALAAMARSHIWDWVAAAAIVQEAGGQIRHFDGKPVDWRGIVDGRLLWPPLFVASADLWDPIVGTITLRATDTE